ncbi:hypothetical protein SUGI_0257780 [Cryptomeria japonica]|nr:hypothetical protein SUGI_0257780 [Cryptomeria japonica]
MAPYTCQNGMGIGYCVDDGRYSLEHVDKMLPLLQNADLMDKVVLLRVDHNVFPLISLPRMYNIVERGGSSAINV